MTTERRLDIAIGLALIVGIALAGRLATLPRPGIAFLPAMGPTDEVGAMQAPGGPERAVLVRYARIGDWVTIEDLARGALAAHEGKLGAPLEPAERAKLADAVRLADQHRQELLAAEAELQSAQQAQDALAREIVATFTPEQKAWVLAQRDNVSVGVIEAEYWRQLALALE